MKIARILLVLTFLAAIYFGMRCAAADTPPDTSPIHRLKVYGNKGDFTATAFFIDAHRLLTAAHTFKHAQRPVVIVDGVEYPCRVVKINYDSDVDCALLETDYTSPTTCQLSSGVVIAGFPGEHAEMLVQNGGAVAKTLKSDNKIIDGMSGCPLFVGGVVVGMGVRHTWGKADHSCEAIPVTVLRQFAGVSDSPKKP